MATIINLVFLAVRPVLCLFAEQRPRNTLKKEMSFLQTRIIIVILGHDVDRNTAEISLSFCFD